MDDYEDDKNLEGHPYTVFEPPPRISYTLKKLNQINARHNKKKTRSGYETEYTDVDSSNNEDDDGKDNEGGYAAASTAPAESQASNTAMSDDGFRPFSQQGSQYSAYSGFSSFPPSSQPDPSSVNSDFQKPRLGKRPADQRRILEQNHIDPAAVLPPPIPATLYERHLLHVNTILRLSLLRNDWKRAKRAFKLLLGARTETLEDKGAVDLRALWNIGVEILAQECEADAMEIWEARQKDKRKEGEDGDDIDDEGRYQEQIPQRKGKKKKRRGRPPKYKLHNEDEKEDEDDDDDNEIEIIPGYGGTAKVDGIPVDYGKVTDFLERLIVLYPYDSRRRRKGKQPANATKFLPTLLHYRILTLTATLNTVSAEELTASLNTLAENDNDEDNDGDNISLDRLSLDGDGETTTTVVRKINRREQVNRDVGTVESVLKGIDDLLDRIDELQITPPWIDMLEIWELRGMINLWGCDIVKDYLMSYPSPMDNVGSKRRAEGYAKGARRAGATLKEKGGKGWEEMVLCIVDEDDEVMDDEDDDMGNNDGEGGGDENESEGEGGEVYADDDIDEDYSSRGGDSNNSGADEPETGTGNSSRYVNGRQTITLRNQRFMDSDSDG